MAKSATVILADYLPILMFAALMLAVLSGFPVALTISGIAILFAYVGWLLGAMDISLLGAMSQRIFGLLTNGILIAIPLFVLMGAVLEKSQIAENMLKTMGRLFDGMPGGLGISVVLVGALLAASTGIVGATVVAMALIALPAMLRAGYDRGLASGIVCSAGTLGQIIPPSTLLIILSDVMSNAFQQAQYEQGKFSIETISVGQIFAAAMFPGLTLVICLILYILLVGWLRPRSAPGRREKGLERPSMRDMMRAVVPALSLILAVLGAILAGIATPTEAAAVGGVGAIVMAGLRAGGSRNIILTGTACLLALALFAGLFPVRLQRSDVTPIEVLVGIGYIGLTAVGAVGVLEALRATMFAKILQPALLSTLQMTSMIFTTILAAGIFSLVFVGLGGEELVSGLLSNLPGGPFGALILCMAVIFALGFFLDFVEISVIVLPLVVPSLILMGHDPVWLSVLIALNLQTSFLTPPFGFSLFYLRGAAPKEISTRQIYGGVVPFIGIQIIAIGLIWVFPPVATWLPSLLF